MHWPPLHCSRNKGIVRISIPDWNYPSREGQEQGLGPFSLGRDNSRKILAEAPVNEMQNPSLAWGLPHSELSSTFPH